MGAIARGGLWIEISAVEFRNRDALDEVYDYNPLLYDLVLKRTVRGPHGEHFANEVFLARAWDGPLR